MELLEARALALPEKLTSAFDELEAVLSKPKLLGITLALITASVATPSRVVAQEPEERVTVTDAGVH